MEKCDRKGCDVGVVNWGRLREACVFGSSQCPPVSERRIVLPCRSGEGTSHTTVLSPASGEQSGRATLE